MTAVEESIERVHERVDAAARRSGRSLKDVTIVGATKMASVEQIREAQQAGIAIFGENRVQDAMLKISQVEAQWHMIGHLQSNKVRPALGLFQMIQSVDSVRLAEKINEELLADNKTTAVLLEVNVSGEGQKYGFKPEEIYSAVEALAPLAQIYVKGLMGMGPNTAEAELSRQAFKKLKNIFIVLKGLKNERLDMQTLSMGMSDDFEIAVEEGSNMVRLGRALFGKGEK
jgi:pyridoxal phosphate enzyme (YggS family)